VETLHDSPSFRDHETSLDAGVDARVEIRVLVAVAWFSVHSKSLMALSESSQVSARRTCPLQKKHLEVVGATFRHLCVFLLIVVVVIVVVARFGSGMNH
jgi:hypothetical protein